MCVEWIGHWRVWGRVWVEMKKGRGYRLKSRAAIIKHRTLGHLVAKLIKCSTLGFGSGHYLRVLRMSPTSDYELSSESA